MKNLLFLLPALLFFTGKTKAQNSLPPSYIIEADTVEAVTITGSYLQLLEDPADKLKIEQVSSLPLSSGFSANASGAKKYKSAVRTYWLRFRIKNNMNKAAHIVFMNMGASRRDMYLIKQHADRLHLVNGQFVPWSQRDGFKRMGAIPVMIPAGEEMLIYQRSFISKPFNKPETISQRFLFKDQFVKGPNYKSDERAYIPGLQDGFLLGLLVFACIVTLFFYFVVNERFFLYYALFLFFFCLAASPKEEIIFFREHPYASYVIHAFCFPLFSVFMVRFIHHFLKTSIYIPRWTKLINSLSVVLVFVAAFLFVLGFYTAGKWNDFLQDVFLPLPYISLFCVLISYVFSIGRQTASTRTLLYVILPALTLFIFNGLVIQAYFIANYWFNVPMPHFVDKLNDWQRIFDMVLITVFALTFFLILVKRYSSLQREVALQTLEKERLAREKEIERSQLIEQQKAKLEITVDERTAALKHSLEELRATQAQLIQSEKMASLGELTAGIAHEIQNPLNFVNNFSEVSNEMIDEMNAELMKGDIEEARIISADIKHNLEKINHHGKRADAIVKGMLQHSQTSKGQKQPTDINSLTEEYLRLAYHGLRAKDKSFNATLETTYDENIGSINIVPQDVGRAILNLITNAFYAVNEKKTLRQAQGDNTYEPTVSVSTKKTGRNVEIIVADNGPGIPQNILDKLFQPFFTTKPPGQGTGLGLSLAYDIIKAHGGEIKVETNEGEGSEFIIHLPTG